MAQLFAGLTKQFSTQALSTKVKPTSHNPGPPDYTKPSPFPVQKHLKFKKVEAVGAGSKVHPECISPTQLTPHQAM